MRFGLRELVFVLVLLAVPVIAWYGDFRQQNAAVAAAKQEMAQKRAKLVQLESATRQIKDMEEEIDKLTQAIELFESKLPAEKEVEVILKEVWELAAKHKLKPRSVRTEKPIVAARYSELPLKMVIVGDFDGYYKFLLDVERLSRITRIHHMELKKLKSGDDGEMEASFTLSIFFEAKESNAKPERV